MSRTKQAVWQLGQAVRALSSTPAAASVPAPSAPSTGILGIGSGKSAPTLDIPLTGYEEVKPVPYTATPPPTATTTLSNGILLGCQDIAVRCTICDVVGTISQHTQHQLRGLCDAESYFFHRRADKCGKCVRRRPHRRCVLMYEMITVRGSRWRMQLALLKRPSHPCRRITAAGVHDL
jgi:hypothetical protein